MMEASPSGELTLNLKSAIELICTARKLVERLEFDG